MAEWWTYDLSDFLMFSPRTFYRMIERHNAAIWPGQIVTLGFGLVIIGLLRRPTPRQGRIISAIMAVLWGWVAWGFLWKSYATINWAAVYFAWLFAIEVLLLVWIGVIRGGLSFRSGLDPAGIVGIGLLILSWALYPMLSPLLGRGWGQAEIFGVAPDPTVIGTLGLLSLERRHPRWGLLAVPVLWCVASGRRSGAWARRKRGFCWLRRCSLSWHPLFENVPLPKEFQMPPFATHRGHRFLLAIGLLAAASSLPAQTGVRVDTALRVPTRDGVVLKADVWRPSTGKRFPVLVYRTPYSRSEVATGSDLIRAAVARGYAVVLQDVRGRYASGGEFEPYRHEGKDGYDTIEWAARQPWSSGAVGTYGLSYPGAVQWLAAVEQPPALKAMVPAMTYAAPEGFWYSGGVWDGSWLDWTWFNIAPDLRRRQRRPGPRTEEEVSAAWERDGARARRHRPLLTLADFKGIAPWYYEWMRHPPRDRWWSWAALEGRYGRVGAAVLNLSGWFDEPYGPIGAATNYAGLVEARGSAAPRAGLILGPWTHGVDAVGSGKAGDRDFGKSAALDYTATVLGWMDRYVKGDILAAERDPAVRVFVMGANRWRTADRWPLPGTRPDTLYLQPPAGSAKPGRLLSRPTAAKPSQSVIHSDPSAPLADPFEGRAGAHDYRELPGRSQLAVFETAPFTAPREIIGQVVAELAVSASMPDFDIWLQLYDVAPDGTAWNLSSPGTGLLRASYREGGPERHLVRSGEVVRLRLDRLLTANRFLPGHRLRVIVSTAFFPLFSINPQTGAQEFETEETRVGEIRVLQSRAHVSRLILPAMSLTQE